MNIWNLDEDGCGCNSIDVDGCPDICLTINTSPAARTFKAGTIAAIDFSGTPQTAVVIFDTPFTDTSYVITLSGQDARLFTYMSKTIEGFIVSANSNGALSGEVSWTATTAGETT